VIKGEKKLHPASQRVNDDDEDFFVEVLLEVHKPENCLLLRID